ncbi:hypothetical protein [Rhizobium phaseoli]|uniref:hypothetical protein n=1 Tax=Rhizobium phaseoli TaxID=396 RepID=UPI002554C6EE|nr:hypothetical protein [Rhizobium phaseoli]MDK4727430.1 hypothetical protein [Rhizobium phaseoli]
MSNIFDKLAADYHANDFKLGMPSTDEGHRVRRLTVMERITGGKGFRSLPKEPGRNAEGLSRGDRKRLSRERANAAVNEARPYQHMHSAARRRVLALEIAA